MCAQGLWGSSLPAGVSHAAVQLCLNTIASFLMGWGSAGILWTLPLVEADPGGPGNKCEGYKLSLVSAACPGHSPLPFHWEAALLCPKWISGNLFEPPRSLPSL